MIFNVTTKFISDRWGVLLQRLDQPWLAPIHLEEFAQAVHAQNAPLQNIWGFIDGTVRAISRPIIGQCLMFNGHKRVHVLKFQSVVTPNGLIANLHGPCEGRRHDGFLPRDSDLLDQVQVHMNRQRPLLDGASPVYSLYGDPAYPVRAQLLALHRGVNLTQDQILFNSRMSAVRVSVEYGFQKVLQQFAFLDFKKNLKILLQPVGRLYVVGVLLINCHTCLYGSQTSRMFDLSPPSLEEYLQLPQ